MSSKTGAKTSFSPPSLDAALPTSIRMWRVIGVAGGVLVGHRDQHAVAEAHVVEPNDQLVHGCFSSSLPM